MHGKKATDKKIFLLITCKLLIRKKNFLFEKKLFNNLNFNKKSSSLYCFIRLPPYNNNNDKNKQKTLKGLILFLKGMDEDTPPPPTVLAL